MSARVASFCSPVLAMTVAFLLVARTLGGDTSERLPVRIPSSVSVRPLPDGRTEYAISGIAFHPKLMAEPPSPLPEDARRRIMAHPDLTRELRERADNAWDEHLRRHEDQKKAVREAEYGLELLQNLLVDSASIAGIKWLDVQYDIKLREGQVMLRGHITPEEMKLFYAHFRTAPKSIFFKEEPLTWFELLLKDENSQSYDASRYRLVFEAALPPPASGDKRDPPARFVRSRKMPGGVFQFTLQSVAAKPDRQYTLTDYFIARHGRTFMLRPEGPSRRLPEAEVEQLHERDRERATIRIGPDRQGTVELRGYEQYCMRCARSAIVVRDERQELLWYALGQANCTCVVRVDDVTLDGQEDIIILENDHGKYTIRIFSSDPSVGPR